MNSKTGGWVVRKSEWRQRQSGEKYYAGKPYGDVEFTDNPFAAVVYDTEERAQEVADALGECEPWDLAESCAHYETFVLPV